MPRALVLELALQLLDPLVSLPELVAVRHAKSLPADKSKRARSCLRARVLTSLLATPAGIEGPQNQHETPSNAANRSEEAPSAATADGDSDGADDDPDIALKAAIKAAVDAGLYDRAAKLLDVLAKTGQPADVVLIRERGRR